MSQTSFEARQKNPEESDKMANLETPDNDVYGYLSREVADNFGEYLTITIGTEGAVTLTPQKSTKNFGVYERGKAVVGLGISKDALTEVFGEFEEIPEEVGFSVSASTEEEYESAQEPEEEVIDALLGGSDDTDESDDEEEETVEISDEELGLIEQ